jgi:hypothetical protein
MRSAPSDGSLRRRWSATFLSAKGWLSGCIERGTFWARSR